MSWDRVVVCITPYPLSATAALVSQMLDSDTGGAESFGILASGTGELPATHCIAHTRCDNDLAEVIPWLLDDPAALLASIERDFAIRFLDAAPPTLAEVQVFCEQSMLFVDVDLHATLAEVGLVRVESEYSQ